MAGLDLRVGFPFSFRRGLKTLWPKRRGSVDPSQCFCVPEVFTISPHEHQKGKKQKVLLTCKMVESLWMEYSLAWSLSCLSNDKCIKFKILSSVLNYSKNREHFYIVLCLCVCVWVGGSMRICVCVCVYQCV